MRSSGCRFPPCRAGGVRHGSSETIGRFAAGIRRWRLDRDGNGLGPAASTGAQHATSGGIDNPPSFGCATARSTSSWVRFDRSAGDEWTGPRSPRWNATRLDAGAATIYIQDRSQDADDGSTSHSSRREASTGPVLTDDLAKIAEVEFQARPEKITTDGKLTEQIAHQLAKINHLNARKTDAFMIALLANRADLAGLPFAMGESCRTTGERTRQFTIAVNTVRQALGGNRAVINFAPATGPQGSSGRSAAQQSGS